MPNVNVPRAVVFDLDGLMFNTEELYQQVGAELLRRRGCQWSQELLDAMMGRPGQVSLQIMIDWHKLDATVDQLAAESDQIFDGLLEHRLAPMPGLMALLDALESASRPKAIATSSGRDFADRVLSQFDLRGRFQFILTAEDVVQGKPHPEIYLKAAEQLSLEPGEILVLEDSENGHRAAVAAGTIAVAVPGSHSRRHDFTGSRLVAEDLKDPRLFELLRLDRRAGKR